MPHTALREAIRGEGRVTLRGRGRDVGAFLGEEELTRDPAGATFTQLGGERITPEGIRERGIDEDFDPREFAFEEVKRLEREFNEATAEFDRVDEQIQKASDLAVKRGITPQQFRRYLKGRGLDKRKKPTKADIPDAYLKALLRAKDKPERFVTDSIIKEHTPASVQAFRESVEAGSRDFSLLVPKKKKEDLKPTALMKNVDFLKDRGLAENDEEAFRMIRETGTKSKEQFLQERHNKLTAPDSLGQFLPEEEVNEKMRDAEEFYDANRIGRKFENDSAMKGKQLGNKTDRGYEVFENNKLIGYYNL